MRDIVVRDIWVTSGTVTVAESENINPNVLDVCFFEKMSETRYRNAVARKLGTQNFIVSDFKVEKMKRCMSLEDFYLHSTNYEN